MACRHAGLIRSLADGRKPARLYTCMYALECISQPTSEPVSVATLKAHLRLNTSDEDSLLAGYLLAARQLFELLTDRACLTSTWRMHLDAFPRVFRLPRCPLQSVTSISYYDSNDNTATLSPSSYAVDAKREPGRIVPTTFWPDWRVFSVWPSLSYRVSPKIAVTFVAGWTDDTIPQLVKQGILLLASHYYRHREAEVEAKLETLPMGFQSVVSMYRSGFMSNMNPPMFGNPGYAIE